MTVYNGLPYLAEAIDSVLRQTMTDLELLIIDDASIDGSDAVIARCRDPRLRVVRNARNVGQVASLNTGLALARAPFLARLDQDDVCAPQRLARQLEVLESRPEVGVVGSWVMFIDAQGKSSGVVGMRQIGDYGAFLGALMTHASPVAHPSAMFRTSVLRGVGGYDESFGLCEDYALWGSLALHRAGAIVLRQPLVKMRIHQAQQSQQRTDEQRANARRAHDRLIAALCPGRDAAALASLLRFDESFWRQARAPGAVQARLAQLDEAVRGIAQHQHLTAHELASLRLRLAWWVGHGALTGLLEQRAHTHALNQYARRRGARMIIYPAVFGYPVCVVLLALLGRRGRSALTTFALWLGRQKYAWRLFLGRLHATLDPGSRER